MTQLVDMFPFLMELADCETPPTCQGRSLMPWLRHEQPEGRDAVLSEIYLHGMMNFCVRTRNHKYAMNGEGTGFMLFDLKADPLEQHNLCGNAGTEGLEAELRNRLLELIASSQHHQ